MTYKPTDAELDALRQADNGELNFVTLRQFRVIARAALAKWGSPVVAGEPVGWRLKDEEASRHYGKEIYVYYGKEDFQEGVDPCDFIAGIEALTTLRPTQAQAVPAYPPLPEADKVMTPSHSEPYALWGFGKLMDYAKAYHAAQAQAGAVPLTHDEALDAFCHTPGIHQFVQAFMAGVRFAEQHHGIKGGQHGESV